MKLATFIPMDAANLRTSKIPNTLENTASRPFAMSNDQSSNQEFLDLFREFGEISPKKKIPVANTTDQTPLGFLMAEFINQNIHEESFTPVEKVKIEYWVQNLEHGSSLDDQFNSNIKDIMPKQTSSYEEFSKKPNGSVATPTTMSTLNLATPTSLKDLDFSKENVGKEALRSFHEKVMMSTQEGSRFENALPILKQPGKLDPIAVARTTFEKSSVAITAISISEYTSQISVLPSIAPHEISPVITRSMAEFAGKKIDVHNATNSDTANGRSIKSIELQLVPRSLGVIEVKLTRNNGQMNIMIRTQTAEAENILRGETGTLQELIRSTGSIIDDIKVIILQQSDLEQSQQRQEKSHDSSFQQFDKNEDKKSSAEHQASRTSDEDSILKSNNQNAKDATSRNGWYF